MKYLPAVRAAAVKKGFEPDHFVLLDTAKDTPYKIVDVSAGDSPRRSVRLKLADGNLHSLELNSGLIKQLQDEAYKKVRLCFPEDLREDVTAILPAKMRS